MLVLSEKFLFLSSVQISDRKVNNLEENQQKTCPYFITYSHKGALNPNFLNLTIN